MGRIEQIGADHCWPDQETIADVIDYPRVEPLPGALSLGGGTV